MLSPICIFAYNRPIHLERTLNALARNFQADQSQIYIFIDGPKNKSDFSEVNESIRISHNIEGFKHKQVIISEKNKGLAESIKTGVNKIFETHSKVIVLEDDILTSDYFLEYMNAALEKYKNFSDVASIQSFSIIPGVSEQCFFLPGADCWGWATWKDRWANVNWNSKVLLKEIILAKSEKKFNFNNSYNFSLLLSKESKKIIDSWAICWQASVFLKDMKSLYPPVNLSSNIGFDESATNTKTREFVFQNPEIENVNFGFPNSADVDSDLFNKVSKAYFYSTKNLIYLRKIVRMIKNSQLYLRYRTLQANKW
jgi:hypothetical protein